MGEGGAREIGAGDGGAAAGGGGGSAGNGGRGSDAGSAALDGRAGSEPGDASGGTSAPGADAGSELPLCVAGALVAGDGNDYRLGRSFGISVALVRANSELFFDWSGATEDIAGRPMDPTRIRMLELVQWKLTIDDFETKLYGMTLDRADMRLLGTIYPDPGVTHASLFELTRAGQPLTPSEILGDFDPDAYPPHDFTYTAIVAEGTTLGEGTRTLTPFQITSTGVPGYPTDLAIAGTTKLGFEATFSSLVPLRAPLGDPSVTLDWTGVGTTARGTPLDPAAITQVRVGRYSRTPAELESNFPDLEAIADEIYAAGVASGTTLELSSLTSATGAPFPGIDADHTWLLALDCTTCFSGAPQYMTLLTPCAR